MKRIWKWLEANSQQLQGLAAVAAILTALVAVPFFASSWLRPDLAITVRADSPTVPPELQNWIREASLTLKTLPSANEGQADHFSSLRKLQVTGPLSPLREKNSWRLGEPGRLRVDVLNSADRIVSGVRLRFDRAYPSWGITLTATFLTPEEVADWQKKLSTEQSGPSVIFPELPPLPPKGALTITAYGDVADADVSATVAGASFRIVPTVRVEDKWPISVVLRPFWVVAALGPVMMVVLFLVSRFEQRTWRRARRYISYDLACTEAKAGRETSALALLEEAVASGYNNFDHMRTDPDLEGLRKTDAFKRISGS